MNISRLDALRTVEAMNHDLLSTLRRNDIPQGGYTEKTFRASNGGDHQKLRGIPAIGRGVAGHIPGTHPDRIANNRWA